MAVTASRRNYLTLAELAEFADIEITDNDEAYDQISMAEEIIDSYVGYQEKFFHYNLDGKASAGGSTSQFTLDLRHINSYPFIDFFAGAMVEVIGGTNLGQRKCILGSTVEGVITTEAFTSAFDTTSVYRIFQLGKFPRKIDVFFNSYETPFRYYKQIPEAVKRAIAAQVEYIIQMGSEFFATDAVEKNSESIGDYSYTRKPNSVGVNRIIAPKAKILLRGITNRAGSLVI